MTCDVWQVTHDIWHMTGGIYHVACDMCRKVNILSKCQVPSSYGLGVKLLWQFLEKGWLYQWNNEVINDKGVFWTTPATPGLFKTLQIYCLPGNSQSVMPQLAPLCLSNCGNSGGKVSSLHVLSITQAVRTVVCHQIHGLGTLMVGYDCLLHIL